MTYKELYKWFVHQLLDPEVSPETLDKIYMECRETEAWDRASEDMKMMIRSAVNYCIAKKLLALGKWNEEQKELLKRYPLEKWMRAGSRCGNETAPQQSHEAETRVIV